MACRGAQRLDKHYRYLYLASAMSLEDVLWRAEMRSWEDSLRGHVWWPRAMRPRAMWHARCW